MPRQPHMSNPNSPGTEPHLRPYPAVICDDCGTKWGRRTPKECTMWQGTCGLCGRAAVVTETRDYGHLRSGWEKAE